MNKNHIIVNLKLTPHPEGGYYRETYRSPGIIEQNSLSVNYSGARNYSTCIYFMLESESFSALHRILQDEIWHFYEGSPIRMHLISPDGEYTTVRIGRDIENGEVPQFVVPGGFYFGAEVIEDNSFSLVGCTVSPGFDFADFDLPKAADLINKFPHLESVIKKLTR